MEPSFSPPLLVRVLMMPDYREGNPYQIILAKALQTENVEVFFPFGYRRVLPIYRASKQDFRNIDVLHLHWLSPYFKGKNILTRLIYSAKFLIDILLTKASGIKIVWTVHNFISHDSQFPELERLVQRVLLNIVDELIFHSEFSLKHFTEVSQFKNRSQVIPHGHYRGVYESEISKLKARNELQLPLSSFIYLNLGMIRPYKGIEKLLLVWKDSMKVLQKSTLLIAGNALDTNYRSKIITLSSKIENVIFYMDFIKDEQIHLFFSAADVVILPFEKILTSGSLILAMSYSKPIIAPRAGGIAETLGDADWLLYDPNDQQGLFKAIVKSQTIDLSALSQLVKEVCNCLSWEAIAKSTKKVYESC